MASKIADAVLTFALMKRLATPFEKWPAYKEGIIDEKGKVLKPQRTLTAFEREKWGRFDIVAANIKKLLNKIPGASTKLGSMATAAFLFKEGIELMADERLERKLEKHLTEDIIPVGSPGGGGDTGGASNIVGGGKIAGVGIGPQGEPPKRGLKKIRSVINRKKTDVGT